LIPEEIRESRPDSSAAPPPASAIDPDAGLRQAVVRFLESRNDPSGIRDVLLETVEETLLRYLLDSGRYSQRELADLLALSRVTLRKKLDHYRLS
jgi:DNA-binding protein Fis